MMQMLLIINVLVKNYEFELTPHQTIEIGPMIILRPKNGIQMRFKKK
jgi:hypothetical protein